LAPVGGQRLAGAPTKPIASGDQRCCAAASAVAASGLATQKTVPMKATAATLESGIMAGGPASSMGEGARCRSAQSEMVFTSRWHTS
jgi:hypothetical protein